jgi:hypothetical protein
LKSLNRRFDVFGLSGAFWGILRKIAIGRRSRFGGRRSKEGNGDFAH